MRSIVEAVVGVGQKRSRLGAEGSRELAESMVGAAVEEQRRCRWEEGRSSGRAESRKEGALQDKRGA